MPFLEETNRSLQKQIAKVQDELLDAQRQLIERRAMITLGGQDSGAESDSLQRPEPVPTSYENLLTVPFELGPKSFRDGDLIAIEEVVASLTAPRGR